MIPNRLLPRSAIPGLFRTAPARHAFYDAAAFTLMLAVLLFVAWGVSQMARPIASIENVAIGLEPSNLPFYALRTTLRMFAAMGCALIFSLVYATLAAKSRRAGQILVPLLDVMQSVPVLGYISFTVTAFIALFPGSTFGVELAAIFAIFTSQAWNMTFSLYQSMRTLPRDICEAACVLRLSGWQQFWRVELPFAAPGLVWNAMVSMSAGWFFVVASEAITVGNQRFTLPGVGSYIALAIEQRNLGAIGWAIATMMVVIMLYDQLLFRPLVAWSDRFRYEQGAGDEMPHSWVLQLFRTSRLVKMLTKPFAAAFNAALNLRLFNIRPPESPFSQWSDVQRRWLDRAWNIGLLLACVLAVGYSTAYLHALLGWEEILHVALLSLVTLVRVMVLIALVSLLWVPVGVYVGMRPKLAERVQPLAQFLAAFPANLIFPLAVIVITRHSLNPDIWLSPLIVLGTQWYILFNVIAGASAFPAELRDAARSLRVGGWLWWKRVILPGIFPYYLTGAITAAGGAWNASIVAELVVWGNTKVSANGLGAYIAEMTAAGDYHRIALGMGMMSLCVVLFNRFFWRPLYELSMRKLRHD